VTRTATVAGRLARLGLGADAEAVLDRLGLDPDADAGAVAALAAGAEPRRALAACDQLAGRAPSTWAALLRHLRGRPRLPRARAAPAMAVPAPRVEPLRRLALLAGASDAAPGLLVTDPGLLAPLTGDLAPWGVADVERAARAALAHPGPEAGRRLARAQRRGLLRVALRDLAGLAGFDAVAAELSDLAEGVLRAALDHVVADLGAGAGLAVIAMGKLGGAELNYVSDVDVLFVTRGDPGPATRAAERLLRLVGGVTPEGRPYELDAALRPEGRDGPLVRSLDGYRAYYERWAATWESQALLKARPVAGDPAVGAAFVELVAPFVWPDRRRAAQVDELQALKGVVEGSPKVRRAGEREVKLAPGGLRDIEFAVQLLQLVHGRHDPSLRARGTLPALAALAAGGHIGEDDARTFAGAYRFLRTVEHRLQLRGLRRTHALPQDPVARARLARASGYRDGAERDAGAQFEDDLRRVRGEVRRVHEKLFYRPLLGRFAEVGATDLVADPAAVRERLVALGFARPDEAVRHLQALTAGTGRRAKLLRTLLPGMLPPLAATPDPDGGLVALRSLAERLDSSPTLLAALRDRPVVAEVLVTLLGSSPLIGRWLERQPELLAFLADERELARPRDREGYRRLAVGLTSRRSGEDELADALRRLARREMARIALRDLAGYSADAPMERTWLAEACLEAAVAAVTPPHVTLAVLGLGTFGGRELGYASDLDVLVVHEPAEARADALRATEQVVRLLADPTPEGRAFTVDLRLRPEGKDGPLSRSLGSYRVYYERWAQTWELQALTQARPVAGDPALGRAFVEVHAALVYPREVPDGRLADVRAMKRRVEAERRPRRRAARAGAGGADPVDLKLGPGGMSDVEWTVQLLQLAEGGRLPRLRRRGTVAALEACAAEGVLAEDDAAVLREGYALLARVRDLLFLSGARDPNVLPGDDAVPRRAAALLDPDHPDPAALRARLATAMAAVRGVHLRVVDG